MTEGINLAARLSLSFLWLFTGITSVLFAKDIGYQVLSNAGIERSLATFGIFSGSVLDVIIGIWLLAGRSLKNCYLVQMIVIFPYTILLSFIDPKFWLHPFGPLTKNIPLLVLIYYLHCRERLHAA